MYKTHSYSIEIPRWLLLVDIGKNDLELKTLAEDSTLNILLTSTNAQMGWIFNMSSTRPKVCKSNHESLNLNIDMHFFNAALAWIQRLLLTITNVCAIYTFLFLVFSVSSSCPVDIKRNKLTWIFSLIFQLMKSYFYDYILNQINLFGEFSLNLKEKKYQTKWIHFFLISKLNQIELWKI